MGLANQVRSGVRVESGYLQPTTFGDPNAAENRQNAAENQRATIAPIPLRKVLQQGSLIIICIYSKARVTGRNGTRSHR